MLLAADDVLVGENVIARLVEQAKKQDVEWIVPKTALGRMNGPQEPEESISKLLAAGDAAQLFEALCFHCCLPASGGFYRRETLLTAGGFDRRFRLVEDWPLFLRLMRGGIVPKESSEVVVLRNMSGVSQSRAAKNFAYQSDLIRVMKEMIEPEAWRLPDKARKKLSRWIQSKEAIFQLRFSCPSVIDKMKWVLTHIDIIVERIVWR